MPPKALPVGAAVYGFLFRLVAETLRTIAADPRHLGAETGFFPVLHTLARRSPITPICTG